MKLIINNITTQAVISGLDNAVCDVYKELRNYLRVRPSNYGMILKQMARRGAKGWDGYTYFINAKSIFPSGFLPLVVSFLTDLGVKVTLEDKRVNVPGWIGNDDLYFHGPLGELAEHQKEAIKATLNSCVALVCKDHNDSLIHYPRGIWDMATNSRKTATAGCLIQNIDNPKAIMLVGEQGLLKQHYAYYKTVFTGRGEVGFITSSKQQLGSILTICMIRTLHNRLKKSVTLQRDLWNKFNVLICDEMHDLAGRQATYVINKINAGVRIGMSGTPLQGSDKIARFRLIGMFGPVLLKVSKKYLMENGFSLIPKIKIYHNPTTSRALNYDQEFAEVVTESVARAELVADIICKYRKHKILITFYERKHGELMYNTFIERYPTLAHLADWVHGEHDDRTERVNKYINNETRILFGSTILQQGYNIPNIEVGINALAEKSAVSISQFCGRLERLDGDATHFIWVDFFDCGNHMTKHSKKRIQLYKAEDYPEPIEFKYDNKRGVPIV